MTDKEIVEWVREAAQRLDRRVDAVHAPEDAAVLKLCERIGYGAVIDSAFRQWERKQRAQGMWGAAHAPVGCLAFFMDKPTELTESQ